MAFTQAEKIELATEKIGTILRVAKSVATAKKVAFQKVATEKLLEIFLDGQAEGWNDGFEAGKQYALKCAFEEVTEPPANPFIKVYE